MEQWAPIIETLGGGLSAAVIFVLGLAVWALWKRVNELQDSRIEDHRNHSGQMLESIRTLDEALRVVRERQ